MHISINDLEYIEEDFIENVFNKNPDEVIFINEMGHTKFVMISFAHYNKLRECELDVAIAESTNK